MFLNGQMTCHYRFVLEFTPQKVLLQIIDFWVKILSMVLKMLKIVHYSRLNLDQKPSWNQWQVPLEKRQTMIWPTTGSFATMYINVFWVKRVWSLNTVHLFSPRVNLTENLIIALSFAGMKGFLLWLMLLVPFSENEISELGAAAQFSAVSQKAKLFPFSWKYPMTGLLLFLWTTSFKHSSLALWYGEIHDIFQIEWSTTV